MTNPITRIQNWLTTDGPGHTDYPHTDIRAHRNIGRMIRWMGYIFSVLLIVSYYTGAQTEPLNLVLGVLLVFGGTQYADMAFRLEALEWEVELLTEEGK